MIADCSSLDQMFSHYIPQLFASIFSTLFIGICMFCCDWRMAAAALWVLPVAVLLTAGSKKLQDTFGTKNILAKRAVADNIQECLENIRDIKACSRQEAYLKGLDERLEEAERCAIHSELMTGVFVCSAQAFLRIGLATTVLTGVGLMAKGELSFLYFLGFLFAAARLYDPLGLVLQNIAATFSAKLNINRMSAIMCRLPRNRGRSRRWWALPAAESPRRASWRPASGISREERSRWAAWISPKLIRKRS